MLRVLQDVRHGLRVLAKDRAFTLVAIIALAIGIGANTAIFSTADVLLFRPFLIPDIDRVAMVSSDQQGRSRDRGFISPADLFDFRRDTKTLDHLSGVAWFEATATGEGEPEFLTGSRVSPSLFRALNVSPRLGRAFNDSEEEDGRGQVIIVSHGLWQRRFGGDPNVIRRSMKLGGVDYQIVGVMDPDFRYPPEAEFWIPLTMGPSERNARAERYITAIGRLKPGVSIREASAEFAGFAARLSGEYPKSHREWSARCELMREFVSGAETRNYTLMTLGAVLFLLLLTCVNVANLQFGRVSLRAKEVAVRSALGATRWRLVQQFLTESVLVALIAAVAGTLAGAWGADIMKTSMPADVARHLPGWSRLGINSHVLLYTIAAAALAGIVAGIGPSLFGSNTDTATALREQGRSTTSGRSRQRVRSTLVVVQVVMALVLMVGAGLMGRGFKNILEPAPGMSPDTALTMHLLMPEFKYARASDRARTQAEVVDGLKSLPGAESVGLTTDLPYAGHLSSYRFVIEGRPVPTDVARVAVTQSINPDYFRTMRIPLQRGRGFSGADSADSTPVVIISKEFARRFFPGEDPLGKNIRLGDGSTMQPPMMVVGIAGDIRMVASDSAFRPVMYRPYQQAPSRRFDLVIRTAADPLALVSAARAKIRAADADQPVAEIMSLRDLFRGQLIGYQYVAVLMGIMGVLSLILACIGVYSVISASVTERTHEIGVRMALGANERDVVWMVVRRGVVLTGIGLAIGLCAAAALSRALASLLFGVTAMDPASFTAGVGMLTFAAALASYVPARRAARLDPVNTLRSE
jgi:putative ABC transport system permease protein